MTTTPTLEEWRKLYDLMGKVKALAPWEWMKETDVFGIQHPETAEFRFISVMGMLGEYYAVAIYLGPAALYDLRDLQDAGPSGFPGRILEIPQLQASFTDRQGLQKEDHKIIKQLGLRFRGKSAWPCFRSHQPGCMPWLIDVEEARLLTWALEQTLEVTPRFKETPALMAFTDRESYLVRIPIKGESGFIWRDQVMRIPRPEPETIALDIAEEFLNSLTHLTKARQDIEIDVFMFPSPVREETVSPRPFFPYVMLLVSAQNGMVLGTEMLSPFPSLNAMRGSIPAKIFATFNKLGILPERILVSSDMLFDLLEPVTQHLDVKLRRTRKLKNLEQVKQSMFQYFR
ncbi:hypothetical protein U27_05734 [Candidatus Vecturithrix granuli]|uniref:Uncharacterized protein n=1 Tax=Vecturithrix granuli TaxID=1499967 RepID=A0A081C2F4_VECG1|nr:hypothetical protein U27_05734 [Candidatus Vecturithrix granuli]